MGDLRRAGDNADLGHVDADSISRPRGKIDGMTGWELADGALVP